MNRFLIWFGALWFLVGASFAAGGIYLLANEHAFESDAQSTTGIVLTKEVNRSRNRRGNTSTSYSVRYRFTTPDDGTLEGKSDVPYDEWTKLVERQPIEIEYLPSDPSANRLRGTNRRTLALIFTGMGSAFAIAGAVIMMAGIRAARRYRHLRETGELTEGVVTDVRAARLRVNGRQQARVHYEFRDYQGGTHAGQSAYMPLDDAMRWQQGERIRVRYDRDRPQISALGESEPHTSA
jgi:hypothetical protein